MRIVPLGFCCALSLFASAMVFPVEAAAQDAAGMSGGPPAAVKALPAPEGDPGARSARSIECLQKADAQGLQGKPRKHFLHECKSGA